LSLPHFPLLSLLILLPPGAGLLLFALDASRARAYALLAALVEFALTLDALAVFDRSATGMQWVEKHDWIASLKIQYFLGVDGISLPFLPLTALLTVAVILASWNSVRHMPRLYYALLLSLTGITVGVYCALDLGLFFLFWELTLPPLFFLIALWGVGPRRSYAATQYTLFMLAGGVPLLIGILLLALNNADEMSLSAPAGLSFDYLNLLDTPVPLELQSTIFVLLLLGFAVKAPLFPFHAWLPTVAMEGPVGVTALLMGLKLGLFGIVRFAVPLAPQAVHRHVGLLTALGVAGALYGALVALKQSNLRRLLAYSSVSHVGFVLIGIAALNLQGIQGAVLQLINFGIVAGGLMLIAGFIRQRLGSTELTALGGLARPMPLLATLFFVLGLASLGVPGTNGFAAEHLILLGAFQSHFGLGLAGLLVVALGAAYFLGFYRQAFLGPMTPPSVRNARDLRPRELWLTGVFTALTLLFGLFPQSVLNLGEKPLRAWVARLHTVQSITLAKHLELR